MYISLSNSFKNKLMNGNFDIWQRGVTTSTISHQYLADRWDSYAGGTLVARVYSKSVFTLGQTAVPGEPSNYATINITNGGDATNGNVQLLQHIENVRTLAGKKVTLSFWAKATSALKLGVAYTQGFGSGGSPSVDVSASTGVVTLSTNWTKYVQTFTLPSISGKTVGTDGEQTSFTKIQFFMSAGTALVAIAPTVGVQTGTFDFAQVQVELGDTATDFESRPYQVELAMCQRYYQAPQFGNSDPIGLAVSVAGPSARILFSLAVPMRASPTFSTTISGFTFRQGGGDLALTGISVNTFNANHTALTLAGTCSQANGFSGTLFAGAIGQMQFNADF
jgi:hypothetical protein